MLDFRDAIQFQGNGGDKSLQSLEEPKNCQPSLCREEGKRNFVQKSWRLQGQVASSLNDFLDILTNVENQSPTPIIKIVRNPCILLAYTERNDVLDVRILYIEYKSFFLITLEKETVHCCLDDLQYSSHLLKHLSRYDPLRMANVDSCTAPIFKRTRISTLGKERRSRLGEKVNPQFQSSVSTFDDYCVLIVQFSREKVNIFKASSLERGDLDKKNKYGRAVVWSFTVSF